MCLLLTIKVQPQLKTHYLILNHVTSIGEIILELFLETFKNYFYLANHNSQPKEPHSW